MPGTAKCPRGFLEIINTSALIGPAGPVGAEGRSKIYGDGSAGNKTVTSGGTLADANMQYNDFAVHSGATLTVPSGTVIRCTGSFTNNGTIQVETGAAGGVRSGADASTIEEMSAGAHSGISTQAAAASELGNNTASRTGGRGGRGMTEVAARALRFVGPNAGGGGGCADPDNCEAGSGGGSLVILCDGPITNNGSISADGADSPLAGGGGGGGVLILASRTSVTNSSTGTISADGGDGAASDSDQGASGGGGGGVLHLIAPMVDNDGYATAVGGLAGAPGASGSVSDMLRAGGGSGGACGGNGGDGGAVNSAGTPAAGENGSTGYVIISEQDPTGTF